MNTNEEIMLSDTEVDSLGEITINRLGQMLSKQINGAESVVPAMEVIIDLENKGMSLSQILAVACSMIMTIRIKQANDLSKSV